MKKIPTSLQADGFHISDFQRARTFSSFLPGIAGECGKPLWAFYTNRGQCISSFGVRDKNGAMLEFHAANKAYVLTSLLGFRTFIKLEISTGTVLYEPFQSTAADGIEQRLVIRSEEIEIEEVNHTLGLRFRVVYYTLPNECVPALVRCVKLENIGTHTVQASVLDGLPQIVPFGLEEKLLKFMSRTMEAFSEIRHIEESLPFYKLKVEPSDKPEMQWIEGGFFAFTLQQGQTIPIVADPDLVFGMDTSLRTPQAFLSASSIDVNAARRETMTGCAFAHMTLTLAPADTTHWESYFGQVPDWAIANAFRNRAAQDALYASRKRNENTHLLHQISAQFALIAGPIELDPYSRQAFLDNTLRGGQPVVIQGPDGARVFHTFTRKHGDMERDYNFFELAPTYWSQGNGNFRDVNQNRRSENFTFADVGVSNIETFFNLIQIDGNNPLVIQAEKFCLKPAALTQLLHDWHAGQAAEWQALLTQPFSPGELMDKLIASYASAERAKPWFDQILARSDKIQDARHGEGYWVDHWIYNLDLIDGYAALYPDKLRALFFEHKQLTYFDNDHVVQPRAKKYVLRADGCVRQMHAVVKDTDKADLIANRTEQPHAMRTQQGLGHVYRSTLLEKLLSLMAIKAAQLDPFGMGLEMEAEKPGWCDALNGLPGLLGSSTHEAHTLARCVKLVRRVWQQHPASNQATMLPTEVADLLRSVTVILSSAKPDDFYDAWKQLTACREDFRNQTRFGIDGAELALSPANLQLFLDALEAVLQTGLAKAVDANGLPVSYFINEVTDFKKIASDAPVHPADHVPAAVHVEALRFRQKPVSSFLEGSVQALRSIDSAVQAKALYAAVRRSPLFDAKLGMYRVNAPLDAMSFEVGRSKIFSPGWLENESIFLHMHYKFLLETLRSGLAEEFFADLQRGLVAFQDPAVYGRSPLENSSFIASSRFPDCKVHGVGFVARLSGATAEWISMVLHMGLSAKPFQVVEGLLRFAPQPCLADWLFSTQEIDGFAANSFGFKLFGHTWVVYHNPKRQNTFGTGAVKPVGFELNYTDGRQQGHTGGYLPESLALDLRNGKLTSLVIALA